MQRPHCAGGGALSARRSARAALILDCVVEKGHAEVVKALLAAGADKSLKTTSGRIALDRASKDEIKALLR